MANGIHLKLNHGGISTFALIQICIEPKSVYLFCEEIKAGKPIEPDCIILC